MISQLIKMLKFEYRLNYIMWLYNVAIAVIMITVLVFKGNDYTNEMNSAILIFSVTAFTTCIFIINSYQESTTRQAMQMYHQIPVSGNVKFLSKQIITLVGFPIIVLTFSYLLKYIIGFAFPSTFIGSPIISFSSHFIGVFILAFPLCTFFAIVFKKNKILKSVLAIIILQLIVPLILTSKMIMQNDSGTLGAFHNFDKNRVEIILLLIALILYALSYRQFFRRQL